ncbi:hypothetical protein VW29_18065 [Devosia limi DSM 17137]|uniref:non-specific protein-tyrosine kinase n=1 Tax=Devosia limi DSM 17137 TaxID=1121477 RepID=A0A0F5L4Y2_9HYPH|nr:Wzz/FepE/Etk N-terminal domain-containing protein [Devosia limi]KKB77280.1 hypothetical protein VW29_18065 [Devosia limi DSM 17137]SHE64487.1 capsular exopolysaccharide family [Devosia limi DSM 17137]
MDDTDIDLRRVFALLQRQSRLIITTVIAVVTLAGIVAFALPPSFSSTALVLVDPSRKNLLDPDQHASASSSDSARIDSEVEILRSNTVLLKVIEAVGLTGEGGPAAAPSLRQQVAAFFGLANTSAPDTDPDAALNQTLESLRSAISIKRRGLTYVISIQARSSDPVQSAGLANALAQAYIDDQIAAKITRTLASRDILQARVAQARQAVVSAEGALAAFVRANAATGTADAAQANFTLNTPLAQQQLQQTFTSNLPADILTQTYGLQQSAEVARQQYETLLSRVHDLETQADLQVADSRLVSAALTPQSPSFPNRLLIVGMAALLGLGLGVVLAVLYENYIGGFTSKAQMASVLRARVATAIPRQREQSDKQSLANLMIAEPLSVFAESVRRLRATLEQSLRRQADTGTGGKVVMISSAAPDEGKSTLALALARSYALSGRRVLLIDCDLRKPSLHRHLHIEPSHGLMDYLDGDSNDLASIISRDSLTSATIIIGAHVSDLPTDQLLTSAAFSRLMEAVRDTFEVVVIDTPPVGPVVDSLYVAPFVDAIVFVTKWASTSQIEARQALTSLLDVKLPHAEVVAVINQQDQPRSVYRRKYKGYYAEEAT